MLEETVKAINEVMTKINEDAPKVIKGNAAAGTRLRKSMQALKKLASTARQEVTAIRNQE